MCCAHSRALIESGLDRFIFLRGAVWGAGSVQIPTEEISGNDLNAAPGQFFAAGESGCDAACAFGGAGRPLQPGIRRMP
jgi:hypothetical protein